jgi:CRP/FNR family transcriptional regulator
MKSAAIPHEEKVEQLAACALFEGLAREDLRSLATAANRLVFEAGEALFLQDEEVKGFFVLTRGQVKVARVSPDGREQILHVLYEGEPCGEVPVFQGGAYPAGAVAVSDGECLFFPRKTFLELGRRHPDILLSMLAILSRRLRRFVELIDALSLSEVPARLARFLLEAMERSEERGQVRLEGSKAMLASRLGTIPETLSRALGRMQKKGIIEVENRIIHIRDREALDHLVAGEKL